MKKCVSVLIVSLLLAPLAQPPARAAEGGWTGNLNFILGAKFLDEDDWDPVEDQAALGIGADFRARSWPVNLAVGLRASTLEDDDVVMQGVVSAWEGSTKELRLGLNKIWEPTAALRPFIGGGLAAVSAELEREALGIRERDHDTGTGLWLSGGVYWTFGADINLGFEVGYSQARMTLFGAKGEAGGTHAAVLMGSHW
ncbi:MAG TPA: hypothetical protein PLB81_00965 [Deltaproteobacteria bacterium]|nr:hypothetical protein [Deltaproteobacteria bacterium]